MLDRQNNIDHVFGEHDDRWDLVIVGGGATGAGAALDAAARGYRCVLFEQSDFGKGTSSRSTKLVHGGVRYLRQGRLGFVAEALRERSILRRNAPHLVHSVPFVVPAYRWWETGYFGAGLCIYGSLSGPCGFGRPHPLSRRQVLSCAPTLRADELRGGVLYHDGQFDDARLLINLVQTAAEHGAVMLNYMQVVRLTHDANGNVSGVVVRDMESGREQPVAARCVINATGAFCDELRRRDQPRARPLVAPSQGTHVVLDRGFLPGGCAVMIPRTSDGRVMFAIPWHGHTLLGTTDTPIERATLEPTPLEEEIEFILDTAGKYFVRKPARDDVLSVFAGIRPLVRPAAMNGHRVSSLSRDHLIQVSDSGLLTVTGGKWTTYRATARECIDAAARIAGLPARPCVTEQLLIHGSSDASSNGKCAWGLSVYGTDIHEIERMMRHDPELAHPLHPALPINGAQVLWAVRAEAARTVDDVLARRTRALHLNARGAIEMAPVVARLVAAELAQDVKWQRRQVEQFCEVARSYIAGRLSAQRFPGS
jgi:glycerol-3-phosphate dehydrogenase